MYRQPYYIIWSCGHRYYGGKTAIYPTIDTKVPKKCPYCGEGYVKIIALTNVGHRLN
jgi:hypothetical protein